MLRGGEGGGEVAHREVEEGAEFGVLVVEPLLVGGDGDTEDGVRDSLRRERVRPLAGALGDEFGDHGAPGGEPQGGVRQQGGDP